MGMSTHVVGFKPADKRWKKMKAVWDACMASGIEIPSEVDLFFGGIDPEGKPGMDVDLSVYLEAWGDESREGFQVDLSKLPPDVKFIRFYNSW